MGHKPKPLRRLLSARPLSTAPVLPMAMLVLILGGTAMLVRAFGAERALLRVFALRRRGNPPTCALATAMDALASVTASPTLDAPQVRPESRADPTAMFPARRASNALAMWRRATLLRPCTSLRS